VSNNSNHLEPRLQWKRMNKILLSNSIKTSSFCSGYCRFCGKVHHFYGSDCRPLGQALMAVLASQKRIDLHSPSNYTLPEFSTDALFGESRGKMFGIMECLTSDGTIIHCKAFSGQFNGLWLVEGWVPPLFDVNEWVRFNSDKEQAIKQLGAEIQTHYNNHQRRKRFIQERRRLSQGLMKDLHSLYQLKNFYGQEIALSSIFPKNTGIPTGTGDCCAPKLFHYAATHSLIPTGIVEFFWGRENKSGTKKHRHYYHPCAEKCGPILGSMLCGLDDLYACRNS
jgi:hypothetical protein